MKRDATCKLSRRDAIALTGAGLFVFVRPKPSPAQEPARLPTRMGYPTDCNAYIRIGTDGRVTCLVGKVELGQGSMTALAQLLAEELDVAFDAIDMVMGDTSQCPWDMGTFGSLCIWQFGPYLRAAGAEARAVLLEMAAERFQAPVERLRVHEGVISDPTELENRVTYQELIGGRRIERHIEDVPLKPVSAFGIAGTSPRRKDAIEKVTGRAKFAGDMALPGTLHARILRPPAHGARMVEVDTTEAEKVEGVRVVRDGDIVAVLHELPDVASKALTLVQARFERQDPPVNDSIVFDHLLETAPPSSVVGQSGNLEEGERLASTIVEETYLNSYVAHAPMETHSAVARIEDGKVTVWAGTQTPFSIPGEVAQALGIDEDDVRAVTRYVGGGFGGKSESQQAVEAARLARITGTPVQVVRERVEEFFYDTFRPAAVVKIRSGLTEEGRISFWNFDVVGAGDRGAEQFYDIPHQRTVSAGGWMGGNPPDMHPFAVGAWRAPSVNTNTFARESHIDILATKASVDPLEFRLRHLSDDRMRRVLETAAERFGWTPAPAPSHRGIGVACGIYSGTYVATMAEVEINRETGKVQVRRVVCAEDQGVVVNPEGSRQQIEGSITMGLGYALSEEVRFDGGEVLDHNFDTYEIPRFSWLPQIETVLIDNLELAPQSCGEPPIITMGAVLANAIHDAVGARLFQLPMIPARVLTALETV